MKKAYWLDALRRKDEEGTLAYSSQSGFSAHYLQRSQKNICPMKAQHSADQWDGYQTLPKEKKESIQKKLYSLPINYLSLQRLLRSASHRPDGSLGFFGEYDHSMSIYREPGGWLLIYSDEFDPSCGEEGGSISFEGTLDDPIDLFEKAKEACSDSFLQQHDQKWDQMIRELIVKLFDIPDYRNIPTFALTLPRGRKQIADRAFYCASSISSTAIPHGVTHIGRMAFAGCTNLSEITLPATLRTMGSCAFAYCRSLQSIVIPEGVEIIPDNAFKRCTALRSVTLPRSLKHISDRAFEGCTSLEKITLPDGVISIGANAFASCTRLQFFTIPQGVTAIESGTFFGCQRLKTIVLHDNIRSIGSFAFADSALRAVIIPYGVRTISDSAFKNCLDLETVLVPASVEVIEARAFCCTYLKQIHLPNSVAFLGEEAFSLCNDLKEITLPDSVTHIQRGLFHTCRALRSVTLPSSLSFIPEDTFDDCDELAYIIAPIDQLPAFHQETACIGFARSEAAYPQKLHSGYHAFMRTHIDDLEDAIFNEPQLLRLLCREALIGKSDFPKLLNESIRRDEIEMTSLLLDYKHAHPDIFSDDSDDSLSLD